jgi:conjugative transposon TraM protein
MKSMKTESVRKRKMLLVLPLLTIPFITLAFWALGGGKHNSDLSDNQSEQGLNLNLPNADLKDESLDKLSFYNKAKQDSLKLLQWKQTDPYYIKEDVFPLGDKGQKDPEKEILQKVTLLQKELDKPVQPVYKPLSYTPNVYNQQPAIRGEVDRLESLMQDLRSTNKTDPEIENLEGMLEKILDIQHPQRVRQRLEEKSLIQQKDQIAISTRQDGKDDTYFFNLEEEQDSDHQNGIAAQVHQNQTLTNGSVIKLCLKQDIYINDNCIPKETFVFGTCTLNEDRLLVNVSSIRYQNSIYPVGLKLYDLDGLEGIYVPGAIGRDVAKESADGSLQMLELSSFDPTLKAKAATAGIGAAKNFMSRKTKQIKLHIKAGYRVLLLDQKSTN